MNYIQEVNGNYIERDGRVYRKTPHGEALVCSALVDKDGTKRRCRALALSGQEYCMAHGGAHLRKAETPRYLGHLFQANRKRFSKVGKELLEKVDSYRDDPDLFSLRDDTAYVTALLDQRAEAAAEGVGIEQYRKIESAYNLARSKLGSPDFIDAFEQIGDLLKERLDEYSASKDVLDLINRRTDLVEAEQRMMQTKAYTLEADQAFMLIMQIVDVVKTNVRDSDELAGIKSGINKLLRQHKQDTTEDIQDAEIVEDVEQPKTNNS